MSNKVDVYNRGARSYTSPSGVELKPNTTTQLDEGEAAALMAGYPRDLISPDDLRSSPASQSSKDQSELVASLQSVVSDLTAKNTELQTQVNDLTAKLNTLESAYKTEQGAGGK